MKKQLKNDWHDKNCHSYLWHLALTSSTQVYFLCLTWQNCRKLFVWHTHRHTHKNTDWVTLSQPCAVKNMEFGLWYHMFEWCIIICLLGTAPSQTRLFLTNDTSKDIRFVSSSCHDLIFPWLKSIVILTQPSLYTHSDVQYTHRLQVQVQSLSHHCLIKLSECLSVVECALI